MSSPWLTIVGLGEDGTDGLSTASREAIARADLVAGAARHLALLGQTGSKTWEWPVPFVNGVDHILTLRGQNVVVIASGDPFWFGAGSVFAERLAADEWVAHPAPSCFGWAAARLGWRLEETVCLGLHAAPISRMRPHLATGVRAIVTLRDASAVRELAALLTTVGFGPSTFWVMQALGGPREVVHRTTADGQLPSDIALPVVVALQVAGYGKAMPRCTGLPDAFFDHDGQITKRPIRAMTLSALGPMPGELLWDIGAGSGSISIEWLLAHPANRAIAIEADANRAARLMENAETLGVDRLTLCHGTAPDALTGLPLPNAVFIGGGVSQTLLEALWLQLRPGTRLVANAVTLEAEALFGAWQLQVGGTLLRIDLAEAAPPGYKARLARINAGRAMERDTMIVAGFGFRRAATADSLRDALEAVAGNYTIGALAAPDDKAGANCLKSLAQSLSVPIFPVNATAFKAEKTATRSPVSLAMRGTGSVAEAVALAAAGPNSHLVAARVISADGNATAALAASDGDPQ